MPLSEFYGKAKGKLESIQQRPTTTSTDLSFVPENDFVELVWENGQIMMQGQPSRFRKSPVFNTFPSQTPKIREREIDNSNDSKSVKFGEMGSVLDDFPSSAPAGEMGLSRDDDMVPWLNYPIDETLHHDYCSELLPELSSVTMNELSPPNSFASVDKRESYNVTIKDSHNVSRGDELSGSRSGQLYPWSSQKGQISVPSLRSGVSDISSNNTGSTHGGVCGTSVLNQDSERGFPSVKMHKRDLGIANSNSGFMNFSHFSRPAALVRANLHTIGVQRIANENNQSTPSISNPLASTLIDSSSCSRKKMGFFSQSNMGLTMVESPPLVAKTLDDQTCHAEQPEAVCQENGVKDTESPNQAPGASPTKGIPDCEKTLEPVVASSSACSGNSVEGASNDLPRTLKRKCRETDNSEYQSEDVDEESVGGRKAAPARGGTSSKRSRAAEVHNLSERRRRDRINEKMRALQELIPNCNKVDKASMLDEAIEYLKTLQLQVQIMSMGAGLYMPSMMVPPGMQHVHAAHMAHFSPMGLGMGMGMSMGMGYSMNMLDMNGGSPGHHMIPVPPMQGPHFAVPPISGSNSFQGLARPNLQVFGHPRQGHPMSMQRPPFLPFSGSPNINPATGVNASGLPVPAENPISAPPSSSMDLIQNTNSKAMHNTDANSSKNPTSNQVVIDRED